MSGTADARGDGWCAVLRAPHSPRLLCATLVGRLPGCMSAVVLVVAVRAEGGSYAWAGVVVAVWRAAFSFGQPVMGHLVDRFGQTRPIVAGALVSSLAYAVLGLLPSVVTGPVGVVLVVVAGLASPPLEGGLRALWRRLVSVRQLPAAYALDNAFMQAGHVIGPLLVVVCIAAGGPRFALGAMAVLGLVGAAVVALAPPSRTWTPHQQPARYRAFGIAALRPQGMVALLALCAGIGMCLGVLDVTGTVLAEEWHQGWLAGVLPAALPVGGIAGNALYGCRTWTLPLRRQLLVAAAAFIGGWVPLTAASGPAVAVAAVCLAGVCFGPLLTIGFQAVDVLAPPAVLRETYGWVIAAMGAGIAAGSALAGHLSGDLTGLLSLPLGTAVLTALLALVLHRALTIAAAKTSPSLVVLVGGKTADNSPSTPPTLPAQRDGGLPPSRRKEGP